MYEVDSGCPRGQQSPVPWGPFNLREEDGGRSHLLCWRCRVRGKAPRRPRSSRPRSWRDRGPPWRPGPRGSAVGSGCAACGCGGGRAALVPRSRPGGTVRRDRAAAAFARAAWPAIDVPATRPGGLPPACRRSSRCHRLRCQPERSAGSGGRSWSAASR